jgi:ribose 5-phosphate isomerase B
VLPNRVAAVDATLVERPPLIRRLGSLAGKRIHLGYDRYFLETLPIYVEALGGHGGAVVDRVDASRLHYLRSAELTCAAVQDDPDGFGVLFCYTGMGMSIAANKFRGIYAARCLSVDDAKDARTINNANVLCLAVQAGIELNRQILEAFVWTPYTGRKLDELEYITQFEADPAPAVMPARTARRFA